VYVCVCVCVCVCARAHVHACVGVCQAIMNTNPTKDGQQLLTSRYHPKEWWALYH
jgi:hypothetical protein